jgi:hypothetical protein
MRPQMSEYTSFKYVVTCIDGSLLISVVILAFIHISHSSVLSEVLLNSYSVTAFGNSVSAFCFIWPSLSCYIMGSFSIYNAVASGSIYLV